MLQPVSNITVQLLLLVIPLCVKAVVAAAVVATVDESWGQLCLGLPPDQRLKEPHMNMHTLDVLVGSCEPAVLLHVTKSETPIAFN